MQFGGLGVRFLSPSETDGAGGTSYPLATRRHVWLGAERYDGQGVSCVGDVGEIGSLAGFVPCGGVYERGIL